MELYDAIRRRRDVRAEYTGELLDNTTLYRLLDAAHQAPSVGNSQPWDFVVVRDRARLASFAAHVAEQRLAFAQSLPPERATTFDPIQIEGIEKSRTGIVVTYTHHRGGPHVLGRQTITDTGVFSVALAIENFWLAATSEGIGVGWVSFYEEDFLADLVKTPPDTRPIAWLCVGPVSHWQTVPDLERHGWRTRRHLDDAVHWEQF